MTMDVLSNLPHQIARLYSNLLSVPCLLCASPCTIHPVCNECIAELPVLGSHCPRCATPISANLTCGHCLNNRHYQDKTFSLFSYQTPIDRLIGDFKYRDSIYLSDFFSSLMVEQLEQSTLPKLLMPIPLHPKRLKQRGYNQSLELAKDLSNQLAIPTDKYNLIRNRDTPPQISLPYDQRKRNLRNAFTLKPCKLPDHIALIDDVLTTGHTANAAVKLLRQQGVITIELWTIARTISHD